MPNHFHAVVILNNENANGERLYIKMSEISPTKNSVSNIIKFFKRQTTIRSREINLYFTWQPRFHDHIIRNEKEFEKISEYIMCNPLNWQTDDYF